MDVSDPFVEKNRWRILVVLCLSLFMVVVDNLIVNVALPTLSRELDAGTSALQWIVDSYSLVFAGLLLAGGGIGDRFGRKGTLQIGLVLFAACSAMAAFADSTSTLIFWRGAMGVGAALVSAFGWWRVVRTAAMRAWAERAVCCGCAISCLVFTLPAIDGDAMGRLALVAMVPGAIALLLSIARGPSGARGAWPASSTASPPTPAPREAQVPPP